ncbi:MAG TPA: mercuric reductase [Longimicrobium sp.]|nr:mercuric reductase [Longimicrobium sp.]
MSPMQHDPTTLPAVQPLDAHNRRLLENVHPPAWTNPQPKGKYHLVVIGAGTAGLVTAAIASALGARVALIERSLMGGDCLNVGCVPSKALLAAAKGWHAAREAAERWGGPAVTGDGDFGAVMERMRRIRADLSPVDSAGRFRDELGVDVFLGSAVFTGEDTVEVDGARLHFHRAVIATGARAFVPPIEGIDASGYLINETVFSLTARPEHLAIIGGGPIGCELAQAMVRLGARVTLLEAGPRILPKDDPDAAEIVAGALRRDGVQLMMGARVDSVAPGGAGMTVRCTQDGESREIEASHLLVAVGRAPQVEGLGLEAAGVEFDAKDGVTVDERMRTSNPRIYAIGDVTPGFHFTHAADAQARMVVRNALFFGRGRADHLVIPWATYTAPEVAHVGITAEDAAGNDEVQTITIPLADVDRAKTDGETEGFLRIHLQAGSDTILGATLVAPHAGDVISQVTQAMTAGIGLGKIGTVVFPYPTLAEALRKAADAWNRGKLTPAARGAFGLFFRALR